MLSLREKALAHLTRRSARGMLSISPSQISTQTAGRDLRTEPSGDSFSACAGCYAVHLAPPCCPPAMHPSGAGEAGIAGLNV